MNSRSIILVDDDAEFRTILVETLEEAGFRVRVAANGFEALELHDQSPCDLIVSDIFMPDMDGIELIRLLRKRGATCPILSISAAHAAVDYLSAAKSLGATSILEKPFRTEEFLDAVASCLDTATSDDTSD